MLGVVIETNITLVVIDVAEELLVGSLQHLFKRWQVRWTEAASLG